MLGAVECVFKIVTDYSTNQNELLKIITKKNYKVELNNVEDGNNKLTEEQRKNNIVSYLLNSNDSKLEDNDERIINYFLE